MSNEVSTQIASGGLAALKQALAPQVEAANQALAAAKEVAGSSFLPYLTLGSGMSKFVNKRPAQLTVGGIGLVSGDNCTNLGETIVALVLGVRSTAFDYSVEPTVRCYDGKSATYQSIKERSEVKDSNCSYGPEFLLWLPNQKTFAVFHYGSKTTRNDATRVISLMEANGGVVPLTLSSRPIDNGQYNWFGMSAELYKVEIDPANMPTAEKVQVEYNRFLNPSAATESVVESTPADTTR